MKSMKVLLAEIEAYLRDTGMTATRFGVLADKDRHLVWRIRDGRPVTMAKAERVLLYIKRNPPRKPCKRPRRKGASALDLCA